MPMNECGETRWKTCGKVRGQVRLQVSDDKPFERDLFAQSVKLQIALETLQRTTGKYDVQGPISRHDGKPRRVAPASQRRKDVERRRIGPVQILEHENQQIRRGQRFEGLAYLPQHALARCSQDLALEGFPLRSLHQRRKLDQPGGRAGGEGLDDGAAAVAAGKLAQGLKHRIVGLLAAEALDALSARNA